MRFRLKCPVCGEMFCVNGIVESDTNATVLDENDSDWDDACEHVRAGGDFEIVDSFERDDDFNEYDDYWDWPED